MTDSQVTRAEIHNHLRYTWGSTAEQINLHMGRTRERKWYAANEGKIWWRGINMRRLINLPKIKLQSFQPPSQPTRGCPYVLTITGQPWPRVCWPEKPGRLYVLSTSSAKANALLACRRKHDPEKEPLSQTGEASRLQPFENLAYRQGGQTTPASCSSLDRWTQPLFRSQNGKVTATFY